MLMLALALGLATCQPSALDYCNDPCRYCEDPCCEFNDCVPLPALGWDGPLMLWIGPESFAPECPEAASALVYEGHAGLQVNNNCGPCECGPPACRLPGEIIASDIITCPNDGPGSELKTFEAPPDWTGACVAPSIIADDNNAVASITFPATSVDPCTPKTAPVPTEGSFAWDAFARACRSTKRALGHCEDATLSCVPALADAPNGYQHCVFKEGEHLQCPVGYPERHVLFGRIEGDVQCTECTCGAPQESECRARILAYSDAVCLVSLADGASVLQQHACSPDVQPGDLRSMKATWEVNSPGTCTPAGGELTGEAHPADPSTFCCL
jgi:hypothetical protein